MDYIRVLNKEDLDAFEIVRSIVNVSYANRSYMKKEGRKMRFGNIKLNETGESDITELIDESEVYIYEIEEDVTGHLKIAGCVGLKINKKDGFANLGSFAVDPKYRRKGIGASLLKYADTWAKSKGASKIQIEVIAPLKDELVPFYEKNGYVFTGEEVCVEELAGNKFLLEEYSGKIKYLIAFKSFD